MQIKTLTENDVTFIYKTHMTLDFPADELKPLASIHKLISESIYRGYGLYEGNELLAYAFVTHTQGGDLLLLDYLAVCKPFRNKGYGSLFLTKLREHCKDYTGMFIEIESLSAAKDDEERYIREKRLAFYLRNHLVQTSIKSCCFGVEFTILYLPLKKNTLPNHLGDSLDQIYKAIFPAVFYNKEISITQAEL